MESLVTVLLPFLSALQFVSSHSLAKVFGVDAALCELLGWWADGDGVRLLSKNKRLIEPMADAKKMMQG